MIEKLHNSSRTTEVDGSVNQIVSAYNKTSLSSDGNMVKIFTPIIALLALPSVLST